MVVQSPQQRCLNFHLVPRLFPKDGRFGVYFKISTGGDIRMMACNNRTVYASYGTYLASKIWFSIELVLNSLETQKDLELVFWLQFLQNFDNFFLFFLFDINWLNFIKRLCLLPKLVSKMYFLFYRHLMMYTMKFEYLNF